MTAILSQIIIIYYISNSIISTKIINDFYDVVIIVDIFLNAYLNIIRYFKQFLLFNCIHFGLLIIIIFSLNYQYYFRFYTYYSGRRLM